MIDTLEAAMVENTRLRLALREVRRIVTWVPWKQQDALDCIDAALGERDE